MTWELFVDDILPVLLPVASALLTLWLSKWYARSLARDERTSQREAAAKARAFDARQKRYEDRRDAVVTFLASTQKEDDALDAFYRDPENSGRDPIDAAEDYKFTMLNAAHAQISLLGDTEVVGAADDVVAAIKNAFGGKDGAWDQLVEARSALISSGRKMLVADADHDG